MASPQESVTTVNGRRCTRSRIRTVASSTLVTERLTVASTDITPPVAEPQTSQTRTKTTAESSLPSLPPSLTRPTKKPVIAPGTDVAAFSVLGTSSTIPIASALDTSLPEESSSNRVVAAAALSIPKVDEDISFKAVVVEAVSSDIAAATLARFPEPPSLASGSSQTAVTAASLKDPTSIRAESISTAITRSSATISIAASFFTAPVASNGPSSAATNTELLSQTSPETLVSTTKSPTGMQSGRITSEVTSFPTGDFAGTILPDQGSDNPPVNFPLSGNVRLERIVGGAIGGVACLALISGILFFCLRKRKSAPAPWIEKDDADPRPTDKLEAIPSSLGLLLGKWRGKKTRPTINPYQIHTGQNSASLEFSSRSSNSSRTISKPQGIFPGQRAGSTGSTSSTKSKRNRLRKKQGSISSNYQFPGILEDRPVQSHTDYSNPFNDPAPSHVLLLVNPDPRSSPGTPQIPSATVYRASENPFASTQDPACNESSTFRHQNSQHSHNRSSISTLQVLQELGSHALSLYPSTTDGPKGAPISPVSPLQPVQAVLPGHSRRPSSVTFPSLRLDSTPASRDSAWTYFGEPGPSRPMTHMFTPALPTPTGRTARQSDPFDLDCPEVLGFLSVADRKEMGQGAYTNANAQNVNGRR